MYSYFKGQITEVTATHITLEVNNIGYLIKVPNPYSFTLEENLTLYIRQIIREDSNDLYGFRLNDEAIMFDKLTSVKGLGPKGALAILASATIKEITDSIINGRDKYFVSFPGIGNKTSQQIILDLKGKLNFTKETNKNASIIEEVSIALKSLGYNSQEIKSVMKQIKESSLVSTQETIKLALKLLRK